MLRINIITSVLNGRRTIGDCIASIQAQSYPVEHIIVDGGSTDGTVDLLGTYESKKSKVIYGPDRGVYDGMNKGLAAASGNVVGFLNSDDFYPSPDVIASVVKTLDEDNLDSCYGDLVYIKNSEAQEVFRYWKSAEFDRRRFYWGWMPPHPTFFVRRRVYDKLGGFNLALGSAADYELMLRFLLKHRITSTYIPKVLVKMRTGGISNASLSNRIKANRKDRLAWTINEIEPYPFTLLLKPLRKLGQFRHQLTGNRRR
ncbi:MAG TPA: glycosyl transferase [Bacteroidales bacterium]|jgi:glycosyltransferase involved in cell wall biosynthesis|nr:glycosyl transferase [Bacteroidales bacterium]